MLANRVTILTTSGAPPSAFKASAHNSTNSNSCFKAVAKQLNADTPLGYELHASEIYDMRDCVITPRLGDATGGLSLLVNARHVDAADPLLSSERHHDVPVQRYQYRMQGT